MADIIERVKKIIIEQLDVAQSKMLFPRLLLSMIWEPIRWIRWS